MAQQPQYSPDGRWWWDGQQWRPVQQSPSQPPGPARRPRRGSGFWIIVAAAAAAALVLIVIFAVALSPAPSRSVAVTASNRPAASAVPTARAAPAAPGCTTPCANAGGWIVQVSSVKYGADLGNQFEKPESGNVYVTLQVTFINRTGQEQHANPTEFVLQDASGIKHMVTYVDACPIFDPVNLTKGATFGPKCLAFEAAAGKPSPLTLVWTPSFLSADHPIKIA